MLAVTRRVVLALAAVAMLATATACEQALAPAPEPAADTDQKEPASDQEDPTGEPAAGKPIRDGSSVAVPAEGRPTVAYFFGVGCPGCAISLREIGATRPAAPDNAAYLAIDIYPGDSKKDIRQFLDYAGNPDFTLVRDTDQALTQQHQASALGTTLVFDSAGNEVFRGIDPDPATVTDALEEAAR